MSQIYQTTASISGARTGTATLSDDDKSYNMVAPGTKQEGNNPEQFFAMGYAACFDGALGLVKKSADKSFDSRTEVTIELNKEGDSNFFLTGAIHVVASNGDITEDELLSLVEKTHTVCPYSKAVQGNIDMKLSASVE